MSKWVETFRGSIYPWHCDHMGHMNVMYYVHFFDQAAGHLLSACGYKWDKLGAERLGFVDVKHVIEYRNEQKVGAQLIVQSGVVRRGRSSMTCCHRMVNTETGAIAATMETTTIFFDLEARKSVPLREETLALIDGLKVDPEAA
ncbi:MAG: thioesterase family protein [Pseudomonadota bacterium]|nr:thioesterase family protein [Pseudomonadota bacterium]